MRSVNTGRGTVVVTPEELQTFRVAMRAKLDEIETEMLGHLPPRLRGGTPRQKELTLRGFVRRVVYGHED